VAEAWKKAGLLPQLHGMEDHIVEIKEAITNTKATVIQRHQAIEAARKRLHDMVVEIAILSNQLAEQAAANDALLRVEQHSERALEELEAKFRTYWQREVIL
jgi:septal ring factor EnvC (AmiA/AmiB activator)